MAWPHFCDIDGETMWHAVWGAGAGSVGGAGDGAGAFLRVEGRVPEDVQLFAGAVGGAHDGVHSGESPVRRLTSAGCGLLKSRDCNAFMR